MTREWFKEHVFQIVVDKSICPQSVLDVMGSEPRVLPPWDPIA